MQVEKDIVVARDFIEGNVYEKTGYRQYRGHRRPGWYKDNVSVC